LPTIYSFYQCSSFFKVEPEVYCPVKVEDDEDKDEDAYEYDKALFIYIMNDGDPSCNQKKDLTCVKNSMNDHCNRAEEDDHRQSKVHWNQYPGTNKAFSPTLPATVPSSSTFVSNSGMSSSNDTPFSTGPSFLPQQLVWLTMTTMTMNPSFFT